MHFQIFNFYPLIHKLFWKMRRMKKTGNRITRVGRRRQENNMSHFVDEGFTHELVAGFFLGHLSFPFIQAFACKPLITFVLAD